MTQATSTKNDATHSELGQTSSIDEVYNPSRLFCIPRSKQRENLSISQGPLPFFGIDRWHHYEVSWLNQKGKPVAAVAQIIIDCTSPFIIESKSLKLYFNSLNHSMFESLDAVKSLIEKDLAEKLTSKVSIKLFPLNAPSPLQIISTLPGQCLDELDIECDTYTVNPDFLTTEESWVKESVHSHLLKSNCLVTRQPDWGSLQIDYEGKKINAENLLRYIVSFRQHTEFHEHCIERIFTDIQKKCQPSFLCVHGFYTRRGGIDINPIRSSRPIACDKIYTRLVRQ